MSKKLFSLTFIVMLSLALCSCAKDYSKQTQKFMDSVEADLTEYFVEFSNEACNVIPAKVSSSVERISIPELKKSSPSFETYLNDEYFYFIIGFTKEDGRYSDEEINSMIKHAIDKNLTIDFYFNNDDFTIYKIRKEGVTIDIVTGKDGGLYHEEKVYKIQ